MLSFSPEVVFLSGIARDMRPSERAGQVDSISLRKGQLDTLRMRLDTVEMKLRDIERRHHITLKIDPALR